MVRKMKLKYLLIYILLFNITGCDGGFFIRKNIKNEVVKKDPILVQGDEMISVQNYRYQTYFSIIEDPPDRMLSSEYYFINTVTKKKIYPADTMYVKTTQGLKKMPNIKGYTLVDNETYYDNNLYFVFKLSGLDLLTDCQTKTWHNMTGGTYIATWHSDEKKFIIDHTALYEPEEWNKLDEKSRIEGHPASEYIFAIQHSVPFDCSKSVTQGQALTALELKEID